VQGVFHAQRPGGGGGGGEAHLAGNHPLVYSHQPNVHGGLRIAFPTTGQPLKQKLTPGASVPPEGGYGGEPFFTVVMAAYNQAKYLEETVNSVLAQAYKRWELIIVDDSSTDDTWRLILATLEQHPEARIRAIHKANGGLADARNVGLQYAQGSWLCMLDSDDLLGRTYMQEAAAFVASGFPVDIVPGCMRNFDAVSNDWCFPEGWSVQGAIHWNKFHASVLMARRLLEAVGGYDPGLPWGLEDWNFWLSALSHAPVVRFSPALTFYYRHHQGTSMRKQMFECCLEEVKAMVRTNHPELYEPVQLLRDHSTIAAMRRDTFSALAGKMDRFQGLPKPFFWRGLRYAAIGQKEGAVKDFRRALELAQASGMPQEWNTWQIWYNLALVQRDVGDTAGALASVNEAFKYAYFNEVLELKAQLETREYGPADDFGLGLGKQVEGRVEVTPLYWTNEKERAELHQRSATGKLHKLAVMEPLLDVMVAERQKSMLLMRIMAETPCPRRMPQGENVNMVSNPHFEGLDSGRKMGQLAAAKDWGNFGKGFEIKRAAGRPGTRSERSLMLENKERDDERGAVQEIVLAQQRPAPALVRGWARAEGVSGTADAGFSLYIDIYFQDGSNEWGLAIPFDTGTTDWQMRSHYIERDKPMKSINLYCMLRGHAGTAFFDDILVAEPLKAACQCMPGDHYMPSPGITCEPCPVGYSCMLGETFRNATEVLSAVR